MPDDKPQTERGKRRKVRTVLKEFKEGTLHSGSEEGPVVKDRDQAMAIAMSEAGIERKD